MTFFNIFSNKQEKSKIYSKVIIDNREKNSLVPAELINLGFQIDFQQLPIADYLIKDIAIERKTVSDLKSSIINKRIFTQMQELKQYPLHLLIIEGDENDLFNNEILHKNAINGFLISAQLDFKIPIIHTKNEKDTAICFSLLAKRNPNKEISIRAKKISLDKNEQVQFILEGFPNIGPKKALRLIEKFKSLKNIFNAPKEQLEEILGKRTLSFVELLSD